MANIEYHPFATAISFNYICPHCGHENILENLPVPYPNWEAETHSGSINSDERTVSCEKCGCEYNVVLSTGIYGGDVFMNDVERIKNVRERVSGDI